MSFPSSNRLVRGALHRVAVAVVAFAVLALPTAFHNSGPAHRPLAAPMSASIVLGVSTTPIRPANEPEHT